MLFKVENQGLPTYPAIAITTYSTARLDTPNHPELT